MKKIFALILAAAMAAGILSGCGGGTETATVRLNEVTHSVFYAPQYAAMALGFFAAGPWGKNLRNRHRDSALLRAGLMAAGAAALLLCTAALVRQSYNPFIYFRF